MKKGLLGLIALIALAGCRHAEAPASAAVEPSMVIAADLSNQRISAFAEDSAGYMWMGTFRGLNRYNGRDFHQFYCTDDSIDLPDNQINHLLYDGNNRLWVGTISGVAIYDGAGHFKRVAHQGDANLYTIQFLQTRDKVVHARLNNTLARYDEAANTLVTVMDNINPTGSYHLNCEYDRRNRLWIIDGVSLRCYDDAYRLTDSIALPAPINTSYVDNESDRVWLGGNGSLAIYDLRNGRFEALPAGLADNPALRGASIINIHPYDGYWLLNTANRGVLAYSTSADKVVSQHDSGFPFELPEFRINRFYTDSRKNLWAGSYDHGFELVNRFERQFNSDKALQTFINGLTVGSVDVDTNDNIWATSNLDGFSVYNVASGEAAHFESSRLSGADSPMATVSMVMCDTDSNIWLASLIEGRLWRCRWDDGSLNVIKEYPMVSPHTMHHLPNGDIWVGTGTKWLAKYDKTSDTFVPVEISVAHDGDFVSGVVQCGERLYAIVFDNPLVEIVAEDGAYATRHVEVHGWDESIERSVFIPTDALYDSYGMLWIGTVGNGLLRYDTQKDEVVSIPGMPCNDISALEEDRQGNIWVSTQYGLARIDRESGEVKCYYASDGIGGNQFYDRASAILPGGALVFGGTHGLTVFDPIDVGVKRRVPLVFDDIKVNNIAVDPHYSPDILSRDLSCGTEVTLASDQNAISISYSALDYAASESPHYYYMLQGHDKDWVDARHNTEAHYGNLAPGNYTFRVKIGGDNHSVEMEEISLPIRIKGNPWLSWWAYTLYALAAAALLTYFIVNRWRAYQQRQRMAQVMQLLQTYAPPAEGEAPSAPAPVADDATDESNGKNERNESDDAPAPKATSPGADLTPQQAAFTQELQGIMEAEMSNSEIDINHLTHKMRISRTKLYYKVKEITGVNPSVYFKTYKLNRAAQLLSEGRYTVAEIADMTGFSSPAHFSTSFKKHFGETPTVFARKTASPRP